MDKLNKLNQELASHIEDWEKENKRISKANVGWHIAHCYLVINSIIKTLQNSQEADYKKKFNFFKSIIFLTGKMPRGKAKAPRQVIPLIENDVEGMKTSFEKAANSINELDTFKKHQFFNHPFFGHVNKKETIRFLEIHTKHHLKIIKEILKG